MKLAIALLALAACERDTPEPQMPQVPIVGPAPTLLRHEPARRITPRADLDGWFGVLPHRGVYWTEMGLGSHGPITHSVTIDVDGKTIDIRDSEQPTGTLHAISDFDAKRIWDLAEVAWHSPPPPTHSVSDYREVLIAVDGDDALLVDSQSPLRDSSAASTLALEMRGSGGW